MASLFDISLDEMWRFASRLNQAGWDKKLVRKIIHLSEESQNGFLIPATQRLVRALFEDKSFTTPADVMSEYGCFICGSRENVGEFRIAYGYELSEYSELLARCGNHHHILACESCYETLLTEVISPWLDSEFVRAADHRGVEGEYAPCPICGDDDQDGRTLRVFPRKVCLTERWFLERGFVTTESTPEVWLSTCGQCRGEFLSQLKRWCDGEHLPDSVDPRVWDAKYLSNVVKVLS